MIPPSASIPRRYENDLGEVPFRLATERIPTKRRRARGPASPQGWDRSYGLVVVAFAGILRFTKAVTSVATFALSEAACSAVSFFSATA